MVVNSGIDITGLISKPSIKGTVALIKGTNINYRHIDDLSVKEAERTVTFAKFNVDSLVKSSTILKKESG